MAKRIPHGKHEIVILARHETVLNQCDEGDIAIALYDSEDEAKGYEVVFVGRNKQLDGWEGAYPTVEEALKDIQENS